MDPTRFDRLTTALATQPLTRRRTLAASAALLGGLLRAGGGARAQPPPPPSGASGLAANNSTLFVQTARGGTLTPNPAARATPVTGGRGTPSPGAALPGAYVLTLHGHSGETIAFSDRPARQFGEVKTERFFTSMGFTAANPPNAALVADAPQQPDAVLLVELFHPAYEAGTETLTYAANLLHQYPNAKGSALAPIAAKAQTPPPATFGAASLFLDDCPDLTTCWVLGVAPVGPVPGGPVAMCWNWWQLMCLPCNGQSTQYYEQQCNQTYPSQCGGSCVVYP